MYISRAPSFIAHYASYHNSQQADRRAKRSITNQAYNTPNDRDQYSKKSHPPQTKKQKKKQTIHKSMIKNNNNDDDWADDKTAAIRRERERQINGKNNNNPTSHVRRRCWSSIKHLLNDVIVVVVLLLAAFFLHSSFKIFDWNRDFQANAFFSISLFVINRFAVSVSDNVRLPWCRRTLPFCFKSTNWGGHGTKSSVGATVTKVTV